MVLLSSGFSVVHPHGFTPRHLLLWLGGGEVVVSFLVDQDPILHAWVSRDLAFPSRPRGFRTHIDTSGVPAPTSSGGAEVTSQKTCTFLRTNVTQLSQEPAATPFQKPRPPSGRVLPDLFGADLPKAMPYWFCTNRVHLQVLCLPGVHFVVFPIRANRAKKSSTQ